MYVICKNDFPRGAMFLPSCREDTYRAFRMDEAFLAGHPRFDWMEHIDQTFRDCMKPMINRFMEVI